MPFVLYPLLTRTAPAFGAESAIEMGSMTDFQNSPLLQCLHVRAYCGPEGKPVIKDATLQMRKGDFVFLTGPTGSGKTTLLRCILGVEPVLEGNIILEDLNLEKLAPEELWPARRRMGVISQDYKLLPQKTVFDNVAMPLEAAGRRNSFIEKRVSQVLDFVGLSKKMDIPCGRLSEIERRRGALGRAIAGDPVIILADEPTTGLDEAGSADILGLLEDIHLRGCAILAATHKPEPSLLVASVRVLELREGKIVEHPSFRPLLAALEK